MYVFDSAATNNENFWVKVEWVDGWPSHCQGIMVWQPNAHHVLLFLCCPFKKSMDNSLLNNYWKRAVIPLYPNIVKTAKFDETTGQLIVGGSF